MILDHTRMVYIESLNCKLSYSTDSYYTFSHVLSVNIVFTKKNNASQNRYKFATSSYEFFYIGEITLESTLLPNVENL